MIKKWFVGKDGRTAWWSGNIWRNHEGAVIGFEPAIPLTYGKIIHGSAAYVGRWYLLPTGECKQLTEVFDGYIQEMLCDNNDLCTQVQ